jgi:acetolactate synthase-1/2/3 large subunit
VHGRRFGATTHTELARPDFTAVAKSFGIPATLSSPATLQAGLAQSLAAPGLSVVVLPAVLKLFVPTRL